MKANGHKDKLDTHFEVLLRQAEDLTSKYIDRVEQSMVTDLKKNSDPSRRKKLSTRKHF